MKFFVFVISVFFLITGCSKDDESNPVNPGNSASGFVRGDVNGVSWYSNKITTSKTSNTRSIIAVQDLAGDPIFSSATLEFKITVNQPGSFGIGEDEPGYKYYVKAYYTLKAQNSGSNKFYRAYYDDVSLMTINRITDKDLNADFTFTARTEDSSAVVFSNGSIQINY